MRPGREISQLLCAPLLACSLSACSLTVRGPRAGLPVNEAPSCTRTAGGRLLVDALPATVGSLTGGLVVGAIAADGGCRDSDDCDIFLSVGAIMLAIGVLYSLAIVHNVRSTNACEGAWALHEDWLDEPAQKRRQNDIDTSACAILLDDWRGEPDVARKSQKWAEMPARCHEPLRKSTADEVQAW